MLRYFSSANFRLLHSFFTHVRHTNHLYSTQLTCIVVFYIYVVLFSSVSTIAPLSMFPKGRCYMNYHSSTMVEFTSILSKLVVRPTFTLTHACWLFILVLLPLFHTVRYVWFCLLQAHILVSMSLETYESTPQSYLRPFLTTPRSSYKCSIDCRANHPPLFHFHSHSRRPTTTNYLFSIMPWFWISFTPSYLIICILSPFGVSLAHYWRRPRDRYDMLR